MLTLPGIVVGLEMEGRNGETLTCGPLIQPLINYSITPIPMDNLLARKARNKTAGRIFLVMAFVLMIAVGWYVSWVPRTLRPSLDGWVPVGVSEDPKTGWKVILKHPRIRASGDIEFTISCPSVTDLPAVLLLHFVDKNGRVTDSRLTTDHLSGEAIGRPLSHQFQRIPFITLELGPGIYKIECELQLESGKILKLNPALSLAATQGGY
jgi:hypothetical protein